MHVGAYCFACFWKSPELHVELRSEFWICELLILVREAFKISNVFEVSDLCCIQAWIPMLCFDQKIDGPGYKISEISYTITSRNHRNANDGPYGKL